MRSMQDNERYAILQSIAHGNFDTKRTYDEPENVIDDLCGVIQLLAYRIQQLEINTNNRGVL